MSNDIMTVGAFEAKTHLSSLLERVMNGEQIRITKHGKPVARLVPESTSNDAQIDDAIEQLKAIRKHAKLDGLSVSELRNLGRK